MRRLAFVFPGQGSQRPGMGRSLAAAFPESREVFDQVDEALGFPLSKLCFEGSEEDLARTENTQPALLAVSVAAWRALHARGVRAEATAGHSLGEYSAHVAAGCVDVADAARAVRLRGRFMQEAVPEGEGAMAAILGLDPDTVDEVCRTAARDQVVSAANLNGPGQVVVAGHAPAVGRAVELARQRGAKRAVALSVSAPFHCSLMGPARDRLAEVLDGVRFRDPAIPVYANVDAEPVGRADAAKRMLVRQVTSPVRWHDLVESMASSGIDTFVEVGPGRVLSGLVRRIRPEATVFHVAEADEVAEVAERLVEGSA